MARLKFRSISIIFLVLLECLIRYQTVNAATNSSVCNTDACKNIATSILQKMDQSVNPCDNFYEFVCGNFSRNTVISTTRSLNDLMARLRDLVRERLRDDIENQITNKDPEAFQKLLTYYKTCIDENQIEKNSSKEFLEILKNLGGWPVLVGKSYDDSQFDWRDAINKIGKMGYSRNYFLSVVISSDLKNNTRNLLNIDQPEFGISQEYLTQGLEDDIVKAYSKFMVDMAEIFGANRDQAQLELAESLNFEIELANISLSSSERQDDEKLYNPMKISELQSKYPIIPWLKYLNDVLSPSTTLTENEVVIVSVPSFLESLGNLLARTPKRVLANYALWRVAFDSAQQLNRKVRDANLEFTVVLDGNRNTIPRWYQCVESVTDNLHVAISSLYARRNFNKGTKDGVSDLIEHLRQSFKNILLEVDWLDETTRNTALKKLEQMLPMVGYPDEVLDDKKVDDYYKNLTLYPESFLKTFLSYKRFNNEKVVQGYRRPIPRLDWTDFYSTSSFVNAYYTPSTNTLRFPAGILQGDYYNENYPKYVNYAAIGSVIAHEITHGFDNNGRKFDTIGNFIDWWNAETSNKYLQRTQCIVDQYSNFTDPQINLKVNGEQTLDENIADNGGVKEAYLAYEIFEKEKGIEPILPGFESFTPKQLFWISYSNTLCVKYRPEYLRDLITTDGHSPNQFQVIGPISNSPYFAKDFNCPAGSPMNPNKKCSVW